jgi:hypothetical protein
VRGLANCKRSTAPSNGMEAKSSAGVPLSSPAAAQRCAEGAGLDSGTAAEAQSALPSIAFPAATAADRPLLSTNAAAPAAPQLQSRISTSLTDVTDSRAKKAKAYMLKHRTLSRSHTRILTVARCAETDTESNSPRISSPRPFGFERSFSDVQTKTSSPRATRNDFSFGSETANSSPWGTSKVLHSIRAAIFKSAQNLRVRWI